MGYTPKNDQLNGTDMTLFGMKFSVARYKNLSDTNRASNRITEPLAGLAQAASTSAPQQSCSPLAAVRQEKFKWSFPSLRNPPPPHEPSHCDIWQKRIRKFSTFFHSQSEVGPKSHFPWINGRIVHPHIQFLPSGTSPACPTSLGHTWPPELASTWRHPWAMSEMQQTWMILANKMNFKKNNWEIDPETKAYITNIGWWTWIHFVLVWRNKKWHMFIPHA